MKDLNFKGYTGSFIFLFLRKQAYLSTPLICALSVKDTLLCKGGRAYSKILSLVCTFSSSFLKLIINKLRKQKCLDSQRQPRIWFDIQDNELYHPFLLI